MRVHQLAIRAMNKLSLQLHCLPEEVDILLTDLLDDEAVTVTVAEGVPLQFRPYKNRQFATTECEALIFTLTPPILSAPSLHDFTILNPGALVFKMGRLSSKGLSESWLHAMTENEVAMKRWKRAARRVRSMTQGGGVAVHPISGATAPMRVNRFTVGARELYSRGGVLLPCAGNSLIRIEGL